MSTQSDLTEGMQKIYPNQSNIIKVSMLHEEEVKKYLAQTDEAHLKALQSTLHFGGGA